MAAFVGHLGMSPTTRGCLVPNWPVPCPICRVPVSSSCGQRTFWVPTCPIPYPISLFFVSLSDQNGYQPVPAHFPVPSVCLGHIGYKPVPSRFPFLIPISICISHSPFYIPILHFPFPIPISPSPQLVSVYQPVPPPSQFPAPTAGEGDTGYQTVPSHIASALSPSWPRNFLCPKLSLPASPPPFPNKGPIVLPTKPEQCSLLHLPWPVLPLCYQFSSLSWSLCLRDTVHCHPVPMVRDVAGGESWQTTATICTVEHMALALCPPAWPSFNLSSLRVLLEWTPCHSFLENFY